MWIIYCYSSIFLTHFSLSLEPAKTSITDAAAMKRVLDDAVVQYVLEEVFDVISFIYFVYKSWTYQFFHPLADLLPPSFTKSKKPFFPQTPLYLLSLSQFLLRFTK